MTDVYNDVYEHDDEDDNLKAKVISLKTFQFFSRLAQHAFSPFGYKARVWLVITQILPESDKLVGDLLSGVV